MGKGCKAADFLFLVAGPNSVFSCMLNLSISWALPDSDLAELRWSSPLGFWGFIPDVDQCELQRGNVVLLIAALLLFL